MLGLQNEREWQLFCSKVLLRPELAGDERFTANTQRVAHKTELRALISQVFSALTTPQLIERLEDAQIANARVNTMSDVWAHAQLRARERWVQVGTPAGPVPALLPAGMPPGFEARMDAVPALGQHTQSVLAELGFSSAQIDAMRRDAAI
jgi:crotonobetainyl-CoA:carnitine CoA-transferase CaiB-like acyl-CoA transferase